MVRNKRIIYISHCILNQNSVIKNWERSESSFKSILKVLLENDVSIVQLPCPEKNFLGLNRKPKTKEEYSTKDYRKICLELSKEVIFDMEEYIKNDYKILGIIGINKSPSCDINDNRGIFMEELFCIINEKGYKIDSFDISETYIEGENKNIINNFNDFIQKKIQQK